jgi:uncharacterized protein (TIGR04255 family)
MNKENGMNTEKLPKKIGICPIIDSVIEFRFKTVLPSAAVFGIIYNSLKDECPGEVVQTPIATLPEQMITTDPNLIYQAHYRITEEKFSIGIGPRSLSISGIGLYQGWSEFHKKIQIVHKKLEEAHIVEKFERIGLRYTNFFRGDDIFPKVKLNFAIEGAVQKQVSAVVEDNPILTTILVANNLTIQRPSGLEIGSIYDLDSYYSPNGGFTFKGLDEKIVTTHDVEKKRFYSLLQPEFLTTLKPEY